MLNVKINVACACKRPVSEKAEDRGRMDNTSFPEYLFWCFAVQGLLRLGPFEALGLTKS